MDCKNTRTNPRGFTLVELLVVIAMVAVLATLAFMGSARFMENGRKVQALAQFRDVSAGIEGFIVDYQRPPLPPSERASGTDVVYGPQSGGAAQSNDYLMAALMPTNKNTRIDASTIKEVNRREEQYANIALSTNKKNGMGLDGVMYDPWGRELFIAVNAPPYIEEDAGGVKDKLMYTGGLAEYTDIRPREEQYVMWSYGKDGKKGRGAKDNRAKVPYVKSDDVVSFK